MRLRDRADNVQQLQQAVPVRQYRHGPRPAQVHRVQRTAREPHQQRHRRGTRTDARESINLLKAKGWLGGRVVSVQAQKGPINQSISQSIIV